VLITQRTANVTKTILNQCHTVFAMRSYDATSERFLEDYIGKSYAAVLSSLLERQAVLFGRGSSSEAPVLLEMNNRERLKAEWWPAHSPNVPVTDLSRRPVVVANEGEDLPVDEGRRATNEPVELEPPRGAEN
jgi:hypothetical protein